MDRNATKVDRAVLEDSEWWWPGQNEEPLMFGHSAAHPCADVVRTYLSARPDELETLRVSRPDGPLAVTFERGRGTPCRYDAIHASLYWAVEDVRHRFLRGAEALSDHGSVEADLVLR